MTSSDQPRPDASAREGDTGGAEQRLDLWLLCLPRHDRIAHLLDLSELDDRERLRGAAFPGPADAVLYLSAHIALRRVLAGYLGCAAGDVVLTREPCPRCGGPHGRPAVDAPGPPLHFSLSHSRGMVLIAVASAPVGVDVEAISGTDTVDVCARALHPREQGELADAPPSDRGMLFGRIWPRKEAYLKGLGTGLSRSPSLDYLGADLGHHPPGWSVLDVPCGPHHGGAVAVFGKVAAPASTYELPVRMLLRGGRVGGADTIPVILRSPRPTRPPTHTSGGAVRQRELLNKDLEYPGEEGRTGSPAAEEDLEEEDLWDRESHIVRGLD
jgi:4'-phosphopantetheinyl transferase